MLFLGGIMLTGAACGVFETTFNNFLSDGFDITPKARGYLEFPREFPGFLTAVLAGALCFLPETAIASVSALGIGVGMLGLAFLGGEWGWMLCFMILWSSGSHLLMPVRSSIGLDLADPESRGKRLGQLAGMGIAAGMVGCGIVWVVLKFWRPDYRLTFAIGGVMAIVAAVFYGAMRLPGMHIRRPRYVWRREYALYYVLAALFGARKQIFITFGPWVLVRVFDQPAYIFAQLWIVGALLGMVLHPLLGRLIDRVGERRILVGDSVCVLLVCLGYGLADHLPTRTGALWLLYVCYVTDQLLFGVNMARSTYLSRIAVRKEDVSPTLSMGITINHAVSMTVPALGGLMWVRWGHSAVFFGAAAVAIAMMICSMRVPDRTERA